MTSGSAFGRGPKRCGWMRRPATFLLMTVAAVAGCDGSGGMLRPPGGGSGGADSGGGGLFRRSEQPARYTILLRSFTGPDHVSEAKRYKTNTEQQAGWNDLYAVHKDTRSDLFRGRYPSLDVASGQLQTVKSFRSHLGVQVYPAAMVMPLGGRDVGPREWNLQSAPPAAAYTVLVAYFHDVPEADYVGREDFAVQYCRQLRDQGWEAYFRHGPERSEVTVGAFGPDAIQVVREEHIVKREVVDPEMRRVLEEFKYLAVNGRRQRILQPDVRTRQAYWVDQRSRPIPIPDEEPSDALDPPPGGRNAQPR